MTRFAVLFGAILFLSSISSAEIPQTISYQGVLKDSQGEVVRDSSFNVTFSIYDDSLAGNLLWLEQQTILTTDGLFQVNLGHLTSIPDSVFQSAAFIAIQVEGQQQMTPRTPLLSVPYAYNSKKSEFALESGKVDGFEGLELEESQEMANSLNQHTNDYGHLSVPQMQELTSGGFTTLHNHSIVPPENIFRVVMDVGYGGQHTIFTTPEGKVRYITSIRHGRVNGSTGGYGYYFYVNGNVVINWDAAYGQPIWSSDGGAPIVVGSNENFSVNCEGTGFIYPIIVVGYEFDYVPPER